MWMIRLSSVFLGLCLFTFKELQSLKGRIWWTPFYSDEAPQRPWIIITPPHLSSILINFRSPSLWVPQRKNFTPSLSPTVSPLFRASGGFFFSGFDCIFSKLWLVCWIIYLDKRKCGRSKLIPVRNLASQLFPLTLKSYIGSSDLDDVYGFSKAIGFGSMTSTPDIHSMNGFVTCPTTFSFNHNHHDTLHRKRQLPRLKYLFPCWWTTPIGIKYLTEHNWGSVEWLFRVSFLSKDSLCFTSLFCNNSLCGKWENQTLKYKLYISDYITL